MTVFYAVEDKFHRLWTWKYAAIFLLSQMIIPISGKIQPNNTIEKKTQFLNLYQYSVNFSFKTGMLFFKTLKHIRKIPSWRLANPLDKK